MLRGFYTGNAPNCATPEGILNRQVVVLGRVTRNARRASRNDDFPFFGGRDVMRNVVPMTTIVYSTPDNLTVAAQSDRQVILPLIRFQIPGDNRSVRELEQRELILLSTEDGNRGRVTGKSPLPDDASRHPGDEPDRSISNCPHISGCVQDKVTHGERHRARP